MTNSQQPVVARQGRRSEKGLQWLVALLGAAIGSTFIGELSGRSTPEPVATHRGTMVRAITERKQAEEAK